MTLFNAWHIIMLELVILLFTISSIFVYTKVKNKLILPTLFSIFLFCILLAISLILVVDIYTKKVKLYRLESKRLLNIEKVLYTGVVKNEGEYKIGKVTIEIKLVNKSDPRDIKEGTLFNPMGFIEFFYGGSKAKYRPQTVVKTFVVARDLKPKSAKSFRVYFDFPPHFKNSSEYIRIWGR
ncbi:MAG: DUF2393 family protein [Campylobacterota bacterium]|nr:DUF2393 family protein [Campylobacterota bacterium]